MNNDISIISFVGRIKKDIQDFVTNEIKKKGIEDLAPCHAEVLYVVLQTGGIITMNNIAKRTSKDKSTIAVLVNRLIKNGYVIKKRSTLDKRVVNITPTVKGYETRQFLKDAFEDAQVYCTRFLTMEESLVLFRVSEADLKVRSIKK